MINREIFIQLQRIIYILAVIINNMTDNQRKIYKVMRWVFYSVALLMIIDFVPKFLNPSLTQTNSEAAELIKWIDNVLFVLVFAIIVFGVVALMRQFFFGRKLKEQESNGAAEAKLLMKLKAPNQLLINLVLLLLVLGFSAGLNLILFSPQLIFDEEQINHFQLFEKMIFGFFYVVAHFLVIVFGLRLFKGMPPFFIATEKGFCYEPAGVSTGWILWEDISEVKETTILYGNTGITGPALVPVIGIKLINPEVYNTAAYTPLLQKLVSAGQKLNNFQTEGAGDILLVPSDFGKDYDRVITLFKERTKANIWHKQSL